MIYNISKNHGVKPGGKNRIKSNWYNDGGVRTCDMLHWSAVRPHSSALLAVAAAAAGHLCLYAFSAQTTPTQAKSNEWEKICIHIYAGRRRSSAIFNIFENSRDFLNRVVNCLFYGLFNSFSGHRVHEIGLPIFRGQN